MNAGTYMVTSHVLVEVTQTVEATSQAEAIRKARAGEWDQFDGEWMSWDAIGEPKAYTAKRADV